MAMCLFFSLFPTCRATVGKGVQQRAMRCGDSLACLTAEQSFLVLFFNPPHYFFEYYVFFVTSAASKHDQHLHGASSVHPSDWTGR